MATPRIALFLWSFSNDYQALLRSDCAAAARSCGFLVDEFTAENDADTQVGQIMAILQGPAARRPVAVLVCPVRESSLLAAARQAASLGIGWVLLNRCNEYVESLRREFPKLPIFCVNPDQEQIGRIQGQQFKALLPDGGELVYIQGPSLTSSARGRLRGAQDEIRGTRINMVTFSADWTSETAAELVRGWARLLGQRELPPCVVGAQNDQMADGAQRVLKEEARLSRRPDLATIPVTGCDGATRFGQRLVSEGRIAATVVMPSTAARAVDGVKATLDSGEVPPLEIRLPVTSFPSLADISRGVVRGG